MPTPTRHTVTKALLIWAGLGLIFLLAFALGYLMERAKGEQEQNLTGHELHIKVFENGELIGEGVTIIHELEY